MYSKFVKFCSVLLTIALLINLLPMQVLGEEFQALLAPVGDVGNIAIYDNELDVPGNATIIGESVDKRTEFSKEYKLSNGMNMTAVYPRAVHFENNGKWDEIDNTLKTVGSGTNTAYINTAGSWNVRFPQTLTGAKTVSVSKDGYTLSFGMAGELRFSDAPVIRSGEVVNTTATMTTGETYSVNAMQESVAQIHHAENALPLENTQHADTVSQKTDARISYHNVYSNTNVVYDLLSNELKESIVIASFSDTLYGYRYSLNTGALIPVLNADNSIDLYDANKSNIVFTMPAPFMVDNAGEFCSEVGVTLTGGNGTYTLSYLLPVSWLAEDARSWPVVLDPVITEHSSQANIQDQTVTELQVPDPSTGVLQLGWRQYWGNMRFFMKFNEIPNLTSADVVVHAEIGLYKAQTSNTTVPVTVHNVLGDWSEDTITWSNKPGFDTTIEDYYLSKTVGMHYWDVTDIVRGWYETGNNYGMMFKVVDQYENLTTNNFRQYYSPDYSAHPTDFGLYPGLWVTFRNNNGLEGYWDYTSSSAGRAGTGYVNNYSGNLTWIHSDIGFGGNRMPVTISHVYNTNDSADNNFGLGFGWRTNFNQTVGVWSKDNSYYFWEDGDGTTHYFKAGSNGAYKDEDGLELTLSVSGSEVTIEDKNGNKSFFDTQGRLYKMENNQATKSNIAITYLDSTSKLISTITDGVGRKYNFTYSGDLLSKISYTGKGDTELSYVTFGYSGSNLTSITDKDDKRSIFTYGSNNLLMTAEDIDGYKLQYTYSIGSPKRVVGINEYDGTVAGGYMTIEYAHNQTTFTDHNDLIEILQFNDWGNVISVQDTKGRAQFTQYARNKYNDNDTSKANQLKLSSNLQDTAESDIWLDDSFENPPVFPYYGDSMRAELSAEEAYDGTYSTKIENSDENAWGEMAFDTFLLLPGETVKFSSYVKAVEGYASLAVELTAHAPAASALESSNSPVWEKLEVTYTNTTSIPEELYCSYYFYDSAKVYVDQALIEIFREDSRQNLLQNGDFRENNAWSSLSGATRKYTATPYLDTNVYSMTGNPTSPQSISQTVEISGVAGDCYILAGWAQGHSAPLRDNRKFGLQLTFNYTDGQTSSEYVPFNADYHSSKYWQYAAQPAVAKGAYSSITVEILYDYNVNTVYFDGIQLFKENFGTSYTYDDDGNIISVVDLQNQKTEYKYDETTQNLIGIELPNGENVTYTYDDHHNVLTAKVAVEHTDAAGQTTEEVIQVYNFTYDAYGNNTSVSVGEGPARMTASATYSNAGNTLESTTDVAGKVTTYQYNADTNVLEWVKYPNDTDATKTTYTYDSMYRLASAALTTNTNLNLSAEYTYADDLLTAIETDSTTYSFNYGDFAQRSSIQIGNRNLATYTYTNDKNRYLSQLAYGNGDSVQYKYDRYGRVTKETYEDGSTVTYHYDNSGDLNYVEDSASGRNITYFYDFIGRAVKYVESEQFFSHSVQYHYDAENLLTSTVETIEYMYVPMEYTTAYTYDDLDRIKTVTANGITRTYTYDAYGRMIRMEDTQGETSLQTIVYTYHDTAERISAQIATMRTTCGTAVDVAYFYTYDGNGNILSVSDGTNTTSYVYDSANQLIRENNQGAGKTWTWTYDSAGNILTKNEYAYTTGDLGTPVDTVPYTYGDADWGDLLTAYDGTAITYDTIGNPLNDGTWTYTWQNGRELASMKNGTTTWRYTYDANGMRIRRTDNNTLYEYVYNGSSLSQVIIDMWQTLKFTYDANGIPMTVNYECEDYSYITNLQGDVVGIADSTGTLVVSYTYDAWGKPLSITGSMADTLGVENPLRYRGYVYDTETGYYYLQSRYYDPEIGRFINADAFASTGQGFIGNNMFAYCLNNPVNLLDRNGKNADVAQWWTGTMWWLCLADYALPLGDIIYGAGILILSSYALTVVDDLTAPQVFWEEEKDATEPDPPDVTYPGDDPAEAPDGYEWRGPDEQGGKRGGYANPDGTDSWHPDLDHPDGVAPHWDYNDGLGHKWRVFPDHIEFVFK